MSNNKTEKSYSWLRTDRFVPINSSWLAENLKEVDQSVQDLLTMIEDGDSSLGDAHLNQSNMFDRIKQIYHKHQTLAEQYDQILSSNYSSLAITDIHADGIALTTTGQECQKNQTYDIVSPPSNISDVSSKVVSTFSSSESDSESDSSIEKYETPIMPYPRTNGGSRSDEYATVTVLNKITKYKEELKATQHKLQLSEEEVTWLKIELKKNEEIGLTELEHEKKRVAVLQKQVGELDSRISECNLRLFGLVKDLSCSKKALAGMEDELSYARECFEMEKSKLKTEAHELSNQLFSVVETMQAMVIEAEYLRNEAREWKMEVDALKMEVGGKCGMIESLEYNLKVQAEKMNLVLKEKERDMDEIRSGEKRIGELEEKVRDMMESAEELKKEVNEKRVEIVDRGEEKREAIRQLCFSLDYYRERNETLRKVLLLVSANSRCYKSAVAVSAS